MINNDQRKELREFPVIRKISSDTFDITRVDLIDEVQYVSVEKTVPIFHTPTRELYQMIIFEQVERYVLENFYFFHVDKGSAVNLSLVTHVDEKHYKVYFDDVITKKSIYAPVGRRIMKKFMAALKEYRSGTHDKLDFVFPAVRKGVGKVRDDFRVANINLPNEVRMIDYDHDERCPIFRTIDDTLYQMVNIDQISEFLQENLDYMRVDRGVIINKKNAQYFDRGKVYFQRNISATTPFVLVQMLIERKFREFFNGLSNVKADAK